MASRILYLEIKRRIIAALGQARWRHGQAIPSEQALANRFKVSVGTVRRAVSELVSEHVLVRRQGSGTYVASHSPDYMLSVFYWLVDASDRKELPRMRIVSCRRGRADARTARDLRLAPGAPVIRLRAVQDVRGRPAMLDEIRIAPGPFPGLDERMLNEREGTLYGFFQERFDVTVVGVVERLDARPASSSEARMLGLAPGSPVLRVQRTAYTYCDVPVETRIRVINTSRLRYLSLLGKRP